MYLIKTFIRHKYTSKVLNHFETPQNVGSLDKNLKNVGTAIVGAPACGDVMKLQIKVENNIIVDSKFKTFGCGSAIASSSYVTEVIKDMNIDDAYRSVSNNAISKYLKLPPVKLHCSMLAEDAVKGAIDNYKIKMNRP